MGSFANRLARVGAPQRRPPPGPNARDAEGAAAEEAASGTAAAVVATATGGPVARPSLDDLRDRIAAIVARGAPVAPRPDPSRFAVSPDAPLAELPFTRQDTSAGPLYIHRRAPQLGQRIGRAPLAAAAVADPQMLALLALDPRIAACDPKRALYLDTETTGLSGGTGTVAFLVGLAFWDEASGGFVVEQVLLRRLGEEAPLLSHVAKRLAEASMVITFNGKSFDLPLLTTRFVMARLPAPERLPHLDLLHLARRLHRGRVRSCTLTGLEVEILGQERVGDVAGADVVACYMHYLRTGDDASLLGVVEHNAIDVLSTIALCGLYGEPLSSLDPADLARAARTVARAGDRTMARSLVEHAVVRGGGAVALRARGDLAKARGDKALALADYQALADAVDDPGVRLELAKLYEHHVRAHDRALAAALLGTGERDEAQARRVERLRVKLERQRARSG